MAKKGKAFAKAPLGSGKRFQACVRKVKAFYKKKGRNLSTERAKAICAAIGRRAYGKKKFQQLAVKGRKKK